MVQKVISDPQSKKEKAEVVSVPTGAAPTQFLKLAGGSALLYLLFFSVVPYLEGSSSQVDQLLGWTHFFLLPETFYRLSGQNPGFASSYFFNAVCFVGLLGGLFWLYWRAYRLCQKVKPSFRWLLLTGGGLGLLFMLQPFLFSSDVYSYALAGRILGVYGQNPFKMTPLDFPSDPLLPFLYWRWRIGPSGYGPVWAFLSAGLALATPANPAWQVIAYKMLALAAHLLTGGIVWKLAAKLNPGTQAAATQLYLWNPLLLIEVGSGHNDFVVTVFFMLGLWFFMTNRQPLSPVAVAFSLLTKVSLAPLAPSFIFLYAWQKPGWPRRLVRIAAGGLIMALVAAIFYLPFALEFRGSPAQSQVCPVAANCSGTAPVSPASQNSGDGAAATEVVPAPARSPLDTLLNALSSSYSYVNNPAEIAFKGLGAVLSRFTSNEDTALSIANLLVRNFLRLLFLGLVLWEWWRVRQPEDLPDSLVRILFYTFLLLNTWFYPWYLVPLIALVAVCRSQIWRNAALIFSFSALLYYCLWPVRYFNSPFIPLYLGRSLLMFGPPGVYLLWQWWQQRQSLKLGLWPKKFRNFSLKTPDFNLQKIEFEKQESRQDR